MENPEMPCRDAGALTFHRVVEVLVNGNVERWGTVILSTDRCEERRLNVENYVESVESFAFLPQDIGSYFPLFVPFSPHILGSHPEMSVTFARFSPI
ncbi:MAG: hypothetical protein ACLVJH_18820 [Faecalibacterium prausnitzii]